MNKWLSLIFKITIKWIFATIVTTQLSQATDQLPCNHPDLMNSPSLPYPSFPIFDAYKNKLMIFEISKNTAFVIEDSSFDCPSSYSMVVVTSPRNILVIDTPFTPNGMDAVLKWIDQKFGKDKKITAINTHHHVDCLGGNKALRDRHIDVYASELTLELLERKKDGVITGFKEMFSNNPQSQNLQFTPPNKSIPLKVNKPYTFEMGENSMCVRLLFPGHAHSEDNIVVHIPDLRLLFAGCMISCLNRGHLGYLGEADILKWKKSYENLLAFVGGFTLDYVVPGHANRGHVPNSDDFSPRMLAYTNHLINEELQKM